MSARRLAELSRVPDDDPMWMMLHELHRSAQEIARGANAALANDASAQRLSTAIGINVAHNEQVIAAVTEAVSNTHEAATRAIRSLEAALRDVARRRAAAPFASLAFAFAIGLTVCCLALWSAYHAGTSYGFDLGYRAGYHNGILYERISK
ncbi:MAG: hypothetical protein ACYDCA_01610 [Candidatus Tyrphobacter sp.]